MNKLSIKTIKAERTPSVLKNSTVERNFSTLRNKPPAEHLVTILENPFLADRLKKLKGSL